MSNMVPLASAVTKQEYTSAPNLITRFNTFPAAKVTGGAAPGYSSGQALATMEAVAREVLPDRLLLRLERSGLPGKEGRRRFGDGVRLRPDHGVPDSGRPV
jgi:multidrug efflux pump subunit AcrB